MQDAISWVFNVIFVLTKVWLRSYVVCHVFEFLERFRPDIPVWIQHLRYRFCVDLVLNISLMWSLRKIDRSSEAYFEEMLFIVSFSKWIHNSKDEKFSVVIHFALYCYLFDFKMAGKKNYGYQRAKTCALMMSSGRSPIDFMLSSQDLALAHGAQEGLKELSLLLTILYGGISFASDASSTGLPFWELVFKPVLLWISLVSLYNLQGVLFSSSQGANSNRGMLPGIVLSRWDALTKALPGWFFACIQAEVAELDERWINTQDGIYRGLPKFEYKEPLGPGDIRVLHIHKRVLFRPPSCHVQIVHMNSIDEYIACSYCWGDSAIKKPIILSEKLFLVTESAYKVICRKQSFHGESKIWIDSICINQTDVAEKAAQIEIMRGIYRRASHVEAFVEPEFHFSSLAHFLREISDRGENKPSEFLALKWANSWKVFATFLRKPWFSRIWILQEAAVNKNLTLIKGSDQISWSNLVASLRIINREHTLQFRLLAEIQNLNRNSFKPNDYLMAMTKDINSIRNELHTNGHVKLCRLIVASVERGFSKPHDRVFALLGMAPSDATKSIHIDYEEPVEKVFLQTMKYLLDIEKDPHALSFAGLSAMSDSGSVPSWISKWTGDNIEVLTHARHQDHIAARFCSEGMRPVTRDARLEVCTKHIGNILRLSQIWPRVDARSEHDISATRETSIIQEERLFLRDFWSSIVCTSVEQDQRLGVPHTDHIKALARVYHVILMPVQAKDVDDLIPLASLMRLKTGLRNLTEADRLRLAPEFLGLFRKWDAKEIPAITGTTTDVWENPDHADFRRHLAAYALSPMRLDLDTSVLSFIGTDSASNPPSFFEHQVRRNLKGKRFAILDTNELAIIPEATLATDQVYLIAGTNTPFVLRPVKSKRKHKEEQAFRLVGPCYVTGAMEGALACDIDDFESPQSLWKKSVIL